MTSLVREHDSRYDHELGGAVASYGGGSATAWTFIILGVAFIVLMICFPLIAGSPASVVAGTGAVASVAGIPMIWLGINQKRVRLTIRSRGLEYLDRTGRVHDIPFVAVTKVACVGGSIPYFNVFLKEGGTLKMRYLPTTAYRQGFELIQRYL